MGVCIMYCWNCGKFNADNKVSCSDCGASLSRPPKRSPYVAAALSFFSMGFLGQIYNGQVLKAFLLSFSLFIAIMALAFLHAAGIVQLEVALFGFVFTFLGFWLYGIYDAYITAKEQLRLV